MHSDCNCKAIFYSVPELLFYIINRLLNHSLTSFCPCFLVLESVFYSHLSVWYLNLVKGPSGILPSVGGREGGGGGRVQMKNGMSQYDLHVYQNIKLFLIKPVQSRGKNFWPSFFPC